MAERSLSFVANRILGLLREDEDIKKMVMGSMGRMAGQELLDGLEKTISEVSPLLLDAERMSFLDLGFKDWLVALGEQLYDADNLLDDLLSTAAVQRGLMSIKVIKTVSNFFSTSSNPVTTSDHQLEVLNKIKEVKMKLDEIASQPHELLLLGEQASSTSTGGEVYGRDYDRESIVRLLLFNWDVVRIVPIIGIGGLGKTTLARYVFNDLMVVRSFEVLIWIHVSNDFSIRKMVEEIIGRTTGLRTEDLSMEQLYHFLSESLRRKYYLIVLDGMWNKNPDLWVELKRVFQEVGAMPGSAIIITSRSLEVAHIAGTLRPYVLGPLTKKHSWTLFQRIAFGGQDSQDQSEISEMISIGKQIVRRCDGHPLLIRVIGSFLCRRKTVEHWRSFYEEKFSGIKEFYIEDGVLRLSYDHLSSPLIHCIAYCSLLPKDHEIDVQTLVQLWMAQGFILPPTSNDQSLEDVGYAYFEDLLSIGFFHQVTRDVRGRVTKCKMANSMHHLATSAAGEHCLTLDSRSDGEDTLKRTSHVSFAFTLSSTNEAADLLKRAEKLRSILFQSTSSRADTGRVADKILDTVISGCRFLRVLDVHALGITDVPSSIGKLKLLRYLDLSENEHITELPDSINELLNLQTLKLSSCFELRKLPRDIGNLINLRHLEIDGCYNLVSLPRGITRLTNLQALSQVVLSEDASMRRQQLEQLGRLKNLRGEVVIKNLKHGKYEITEYLKEKLGVRSLSLEWEIHAPKLDKDGMPLDGKLFPDLKDKDGTPLDSKLFPYLEELALNSFSGVTLSLPSFRSNLVRLSLRRWVKGRNLPALNECSKLKVLVLDEISDLEYVESGPVSSQTTTFPNLQELWLTELPKLKGWWDAEVESGNLPSFPCLSKLVIEDCPMLTSLPIFPTLEEGLVLDSTSWNPFQLTMKHKTAVEESSSSTTFFPTSLDWCKTSISLENQEYSPSFSRHSKLTNEDWPQLGSRRLFPTLEGGLMLDSTCWDSFHLNMKHKSTTAAEEESSSSPLSKLKSLCIVGIVEFDDSKAKEIAWDTLQSLELLKFDSLPKLTTLPMRLRLDSKLKELHVWRSGVTEIPAWIGELKFLEKLVIRACPKVESLPEIKDWRLKTLEIEDCPTLIRRCEKGTGADWDKVKHIPDLRLGK